MFWIMGHPEVYVILLPPVAAMLEVASTFARKPVFGYKVVLAGFVAICALSIMVWAHHMFTTGWAPDLAGPFMLTTELISIPTGIIFLCVIGTLWKGSIWTRLPMYFVYLFLWNFIIGGVTGIYLSDVAADQFFHGDMFVTAHFHYTLLGGAMIGATAALCYWWPKMTGRMLNERIGKVAFWMIAIGIQVTYCAMFWEGFQGMPRRVAFYAPEFLRANQTATGGAYLLIWLARPALRPHPFVAAREAGPGQSVARQEPRVEGTHAGPSGELPGGTGGDIRSLRLRRAADAAVRPQQPEEQPSWCRPARVRGGGGGLMAVAVTDSGGVPDEGTGPGDDTHDEPGTRDSRATRPERAPGHLAVHRRRRAVPSARAVHLVLPPGPQHRRHVARGSSVPLPIPAPTDSAIPSSTRWPRPTPGTRPGSPPWSSWPPCSSGPPSAPLATTRTGGWCQAWPVWAWWSCWPPSPWLLPIPDVPFTTIDGAYASTFEFFMGSTLAHVILLTFIALGLWNRAAQGPLQRRTVVPGAGHPVSSRYGSPSRPAFWPSSCHCLREPGQ